MEKIVSQNLDANEAIFFARELEHVKARTYDVRLPNLKATMIIPVSTEAGPGAETITYEQYDQVGMAKIIANYADDLPRSDIKGKQFTSNVRSIGSSYGYNIQEIRAAQMAGKPLTARKATAVRRANDQTVNSIAFNGDAEHGLPGLLTNANIPVTSVPNGGSGTAWSTKTAAQILADLNNGVKDIVELTNGVESPNTLLLPIEQMQIISTTRMDSGTDTTILEFFLKNNPTITTVEWVPELKGAGTGGVDVGIFYEKSPDKLTLEIPQPFEQFPAQERGLEFVVPCHSRCGGVIVYYPLSLNILEGI